MFAALGSQTASKQLIEYHIFLEIPYFDKIKPYQVRLRSKQGFAYIFKFVKFPMRLYRH